MFPFWSVVPLKLVDLTATAEISSAVAISLSCSLPPVAVISKALCLAEASVPSPMENKVSSFD